MKLERNKNLHIEKNGIAARTHSEVALGGCRLLNLAAKGCNSQFNAEIIVGLFIFDVLYILNT